MKSEELLRFLAHDELVPPHLRDRCRPFADLARQIVDTAPAGEERDLCLRKLLEAKDAAVRAYQQ